MRSWLFFAALLACCSPRIDDPNVGEVPGPPEAGTTSDTNVRTFALNALFLGDATRDGVEKLGGADAPWTTFGYDLDHRVTLAFSPDVCTLATGSNVATQIDGDDGIDNSFGANLLFVIEYGTGAQNLTRDATDSLTSGAWTLQIRLTGLSRDSQPSATGLGAETFLSNAYDGTPAFDSTTSWPVRPTTRVRFDTAYVNGGTVVLRDAEQPLTLPVALLNYFYSDPKPPEPATLTLRIRVPIITFELGDDGQAKNGIIAGVLEAQDAVDSANALAGALGNCAPWIAPQVLTAQDSLGDGTNAPGTPCNAISIGLGFTAKEVADPPETGTDPTPPANPCDVSDAGLDGGAGAD